MHHRLLCILLFLFSTATANAQYRVCNQEISLGCGTGTSEQLFDGTHIGILQPTMKQYTNNGMSGILFVDCKYFVSRRVTIGIFAGMEKESGNWLYDYMSGRADDWETYQLGIYSRTAYTIAPEVSVAYLNEDDVRIYTTFGIGVTYKKETDVFQQAYYANAQYLYSAPPLTGSETKIPNNGSHFNAYYAPLGLSFGGRVRGFFELGIGYKGIINGGLCYKINTLSKRLRELHRPAMESVIVLPRNYPVDGSMRYMESVNSGKVPANQQADFNEQLNKVTTTVQNDGGNVFRIASVKGIETRDRYNIKGQAFYTADYDSLKARVTAEKNKVFKDEPCAYVVIYCPNIGKVERSTLTAAVSVNGHEILVHRNSKYTIKLTKEGENRIITDGNKVTIHAKFGHYSYLRVCVLNRKSWAHIVDDTQGELESSVIGDGDVAAPHIVKWGDE